MLALLGAHGIPPGFQMGHYNAQPEKNTYNLYFMHTLPMRLTTIHYDEQDTNGASILLEITQNDSNESVYHLMNDAIILLLFNTALA